MSGKSFNPIMPVTDDGLYISEVGHWAEQKYRLVGEYANLFTTSMKSKWDSLVYIDLFANCGYAKIRGTNKIIKSSSQIALSLPIPFSKYIFCEQQEEPFKALLHRVSRDYSNFDVEILNCNSNTDIEAVIARIPKFSKGNRVLTFCFVDPYKIDSLKFKTILALKKIFVDFLILLPLLMDANRNLKTYLRPENFQIDEFLDDYKWREKFNDPENESGFVKFLADEYDQKMGKLGFESNQMKLIKDGHLKLYYLAFYSRNNLGSKFWNTIQKYSSGQQSLFS